MNADYLVSQVRSSSTGVPGRSLNNAGRHHFVIDSPSIGEEIGSVDAFLAGISSCGVNVVEVAARELGLPLRRTEAEIDGVRRRDAPARFERIDLRFTLDGVSQDQAVDLVARYQER